MEELLRDSRIIARQIEKLKTMINLKSLLVKIVLILSICYIIFTYCFGVLRMRGISMVPSISDGDLVVYYRLDKEYISGDIIVFKNEENKTRVLRIVATEGQTVDINGSGELMINNHVEGEQSYFKTEEAEESKEEKKGFNPMSDSSLDSTELLALGWKGLFDAERGLSHTVRILKEQGSDEHDETDYGK